MSSQTKTLLTPEEYLAIERKAETRSEYFNGEMFMMTGASRAHNLIVGNLVATLHSQLHLLVLLPPTIAVADFMSKLKANSSGWAKKQTNGRFAWQSRYGAFTVSESQVGRMREYIRTQEEHHRRASFVDEYKALLRAHRIEFDEAHL